MFYFVIVALEINRFTAGKWIVAVRNTNMDVALKLGSNRDWKVLMYLTEKAWIFLKRLLVDVKGDSGEDSERER